MSFTPGKTYAIPKENAATLLKNKRTVRTRLVSFLLGGGWGWWWRGREETILRARKS